MAKTVHDDTAPQGTIVTAAFLNAVNNHRHTGLDEDGAGALDYAADTGAADAYAITLSVTLNALVNGMPVFFKAANANTGASTLNVNGLGAKTLKKNGGSDLAAGDILAGQIIAVVYDGTYFQMLNGVFAALAGLATQAFSAADGSSGNEVVNISQFASSIASSGYQKLPGGLIIQWGASTAGATVTFPITFPTALFGIWLMYNYSVPDTTNPLGIPSRTTSGFVSQSYDQTGASIYWLAIGY